MANIKVLPDGEAVASEAVNALVADLGAAISKYGSASWVAAGGSTPAKAYDIIASSYADQVQWAKVFVLMGDERCVPLGHEDSNWQQLSDRLLGSVGIPDTQLLRPPAELGAEAAAERYEATVGQMERGRAGQARLDHVWLGMGEDGHTLSLFPDHDILNVADRAVAAVHNSPKPPPDRVTLTFKALEGVEQCLILATGSGKQEAVSRALAGDLTLPVARAADVVTRAGGTVTWLLDEPAAQSVPR